MKKFLFLVGAMLMFALPTVNAQNVNTQNELAKLIESDREKYEAFFTEFGAQLKYGVYADFGKHKKDLQDLLMFKSSMEKKYVTLKEYVSRMGAEQKSIYYACGETAELIDMLKQNDLDIIYISDNMSTILCGICLLILTIF